MPPPAPPTAASSGAARRAAPMPPDDRRAAIVAAVLPLFVAKGDAVTTRELARAAGVAEGTIFNVFADKDELVSAVLDAAVDQEPLERALREIDPALAFESRLERAIDVMQHRTVEIWRLISSLGARHDQPRGPLPVSPALVELMQQHADALAVEPGEAAHLFRALTLSLSHPTLTADPFPAARIVEVFLHGVSRATGDAS